MCVYLRTKKSTLIKVSRNIVDYGFLNHFVYNMQIQKLEQKQNKKQKKAKREEH